MSFLQHLLAMISGRHDGKRPPALSRAERRNMASGPAFQRSAKRAGDAGRLACHRRSCEQAYNVKICRALDGEGHHSTHGIPARYL